MSVVIIIINFFIDTTIQQTASGTEMKLWLHAMRTHNGSDCPKLTLTGLINGVLFQTNTTSNLNLLFVDSIVKILYWEKCFNLIVNNESMAHKNQF